jgi:FHA domain-containing protein
MIRCNHCGTDNLDGSEYCDECGKKFTASARIYTPATSSTQASPPPPPAFTRESVQPKPATPYTPPPPPVQFPANQESQREENHTFENGEMHVRARLIIQRGGKVGKEFPIQGDESLIGRWDADGGTFPDIDLDQDDPEAKVSRRHARIHFLNNQFLIEDLGSTNGTFVNRGPRLLPGNRQPLNNGDEIIVGKTFLKFVLS